MNRGNSRQKARRLRAVVRRDGNRCWLCQQPIDLGLPRDHDEAATLDHIKPKALGGPNTISNLRLAHRRCDLLAGRALHNELMTSEGDGPSSG